MSEMNARGQAVAWAYLNSTPVFVWELGGAPSVASPEVAPPVELQGGPGIGEVLQRLLRRTTRRERPITGPIEALSANG